MVHHNMTSSSNSTSTSLTSSSSSSSTSSQSASGTQTSTSDSSASSNISDSSSTSSHSRKHHHHHSTETGFSSTLTTSIPASSTSDKSANGSSTTDVTPSGSSSSIPTKTSAIFSSTHRKHSSANSAKSTDTSSSGSTSSSSSVSSKGNLSESQGAKSTSTSTGEDETCEEESSSQISTQSRGPATATATPTSTVDLSSSKKHHHGSSVSSGNGSASTISNGTSISSSSSHKHKHTHTGSNDVTSTLISGGSSAMSSTVTATGSIGGGVYGSSSGNGNVSSLPTTTTKKHHHSASSSSGAPLVGFSAGSGGIGANIGDLSVGNSSPSGSHAQTQHATSTKSHHQSSSTGSVSSSSSSSNGTVAGGDSGSLSGSGSAGLSVGGMEDETLSSSSTTSPTGSSGTISSGSSSSDNDGDILGGGSASGDGNVSASSLNLGSQTASVGGMAGSDGSNSMGASIDSGSILSTPTITGSLNGSITASPTSIPAISSASSTDGAVSDVENSLSAILGFGSGILDTSTSPGSGATSLPTSTPGAGQDGDHRSKGSSSSHTMSVGRDGQHSSSNDSYSESPLTNNGGAIAGVVIGAIAALLVIAGLLFWYLRKRSNAKDNDRAWDSMEAGRDALARQQENYNYGGIANDRAQGGYGGQGSSRSGTPLEDAGDSPLRITNATPRQELAQAFNSRSRSNSEMVERDGSKTPTMSNRDARGQPYSHTVHRSPMDVDPTMQAFASYFADGSQPPPGSYRTFHSEPEPMSSSSVNRKPVPGSRPADPFADPQSQPQLSLPPTLRPNQHSKKPSIDSLGRGTPSTGGRNSPPSLRLSDASSNDSMGEIRAAQYIPAPNFNPNNGGISPPHAALMSGPGSSKIFKQPSKPKFEISAGPAASHRPRQASVDARGADVIQFSNGSQQGRTNWSPWKYQSGNNLSNFQSRVSRYQAPARAANLPPSSFDRYAQDYPAFASLTSNNLTPNKRPTSDASRYSQISGPPSAYPRQSSQDTLDPFSDDYDKYA